MTINYGKRNAGGLTAAAPGDTLYIPLQFYNDSGASIGIGSTLAKTDIEVFKNGGVIERATDSGYAILGDTGNFDNRIGFKGISVQIFNTADDTGFYDAGSQYWVAIDAVTVDARTVRFFPAVFEIGETRANIVQIGGDTGAADRLGKFAGLQLKTDGTLDTGTGQATNTLNVTATATTDTGQVSNAVWNSIRTDHTTAGSYGHDLADTGEIATAAWAFSSRSVTDVAGFSDTGINERLGALETGVTVTVLSDTGSVSRGVWNSLRADHATAGTFGQYIAANTILIDSDTGAADIIGKAFADTGYVLRASAEQIDGDTGAAAHMAAAFAVQATNSDTGLIANAAAIRAQTDKLVFDTGGEVHADIRRVNNTTVSGTGATNDEWGPA